jgi:cyclohexa-1,5-dienecarbonyl-CoA hydratase
MNERSPHPPHPPTAAPPARLERDGAVATLWLARPPLNILDLEMIAVLSQRLDEVADDESVRVVVVRGEGDKAFSAGVSIRDHTPDKVEEMLSGFHDVVRKLVALDPVTVAAVDGHCLGGGMELATVCDLVLATDRSRFGQPEIQLACFPPVAAALYPAVLGPARANDLVLTGRLLSATEAESWGLVSRRVAELDPALSELTRDLAAKSGAVLTLTKRALRAGRERAFGPALDEAERLYLSDLTRTEDMKEGIAAYLEKRPAVWKHR